MYLCISVYVSGIQNTLCTIKQINTIHTIKVKPLVITAARVRMSKNLVGNSGIYQWFYLLSIYIYNVSYVVIITNDNL